ncbi:ribonuclease T2 [Clarias gariepinus]|uniref:ribonuclease T2 n=1 Tax=Clarias gariepinus TaxID=13013 RepID=UPI00234CCB12|nr:ribonuclease T2 [Clarias gariepinus]
MKSHVILLCLGYVLLTSAHSIHNKEWTKLILTHHWPQTFCSMEHCTTNFTYWTLHGLWPNSGAECNASWHFNASLIEDLLPEMKIFWPNLLKPESTIFWKHEWTKHGTCAAKAEAMNTQHKYFSKALELYHKLDLDGILRKSNIVPSETYYKLTDLENSISSSYGVTPKIQCVSEQKQTDFQILGQIEICFDKQFQLVECEHSREELQSQSNSFHTGFTVCDISVPVYYPPLGSSL